MTNASKPLQVVLTEDEVDFILELCADKLSRYIREMLAIARIKQSGSIKVQLHCDELQSLVNCIRLELVGLDCAAAKTWAKQIAGYLSEQLTN